MCVVLAVRGFGQPSAARSFLRPSLEGMPDPASLADAVPACERMVRAVERGETILVHGDYDVDGIAAAALLTRCLRALGGRVVPFVPHRLRDGYDFGVAGLAAARAAGATLLVTADSGTRAHGAVEEARRASVDVIITDHHTPDRTLPRSFALVNPRRDDCTYPNQDLSGTGVAFELARLLGRMTRSKAIGPLPHVELVALATIADLVPLSHHNRVLVRHGLHALHDTGNAGLRALMRVARVRGPVTPGQIGFTLAPRINAAGRMDYPCGLFRRRSCEPLRSGRETGQLVSSQRDTVVGRELIEQPVQVDVAVAGRVLRGTPRGFGQHFVGRLAAHPGPDQGCEKTGGRQQGQEALELGPDGGLLDPELLQHCPRGVEQAVGRAEGVREHDPPDGRATHVTLVPLPARERGRHGEVAVENGHQGADALRGAGVGLVGHGRRGDLAVAEPLGHETVPGHQPHRRRQGRRP